MVTWGVGGVIAQKKTETAKGPQYAPAQSGVHIAAFSEKVPTPLGDPPLHKAVHITPHASIMDGDMGHP